MFRMILGAGVLFLFLALITGLLGFGVLSAESWEVAKILFWVFLVFAVLAFVGGYFARRRVA